MPLLVHFVWRGRWPEVVYVNSWAVVNNLVRSRNGVCETKSLRNRHVTEPVGVDTKHADFCVDHQYPAEGSLNN